MCADGAKAPGQQFGYNHALDALARIYSEEGMRAFWKGLAPNIARSALMSELHTWASIKRSANSCRCLSDCYICIRQTISRFQRLWRRRENPCYFILGSRNNGDNHLRPCRRSQKQNAIQRWQRRSSTSSQSRSSRRRPSVPHERLDTCLAKTYVRCSPLLHVMKLTLQTSYGFDICVYGEIATAYIF